MTDVAHATQKWVGEKIAEALKDVPTGGAGGSAILTSPDGKRWRQILDNDGVATWVPTLEPGPPPVPTDLQIQTPDTGTDGN